MQDASRLHRHHSEDPIGVSPRRRTVAMVVLCLCALTTAVDITITNVAPVHRPRSAFLVVTGYAALLRSLGRGG